MIKYGISECKKKQLQTKFLIQIFIERPIKDRFLHQK